MCPGLGFFKTQNFDKLMQIKHKHTYIYIYSERDISIYIYMCVYAFRSGGPSLKRSAEYPNGFASFVADQHAKVLVAWQYHSENSKSLAP